MGSHYDDFGIADRVYRMAEDHEDSVRRFERQEDRLIREAWDLRTENEALKLENTGLRNQIHHLEATLRACSIPGWDEDE